MLARAAPNGNRRPLLIDEIQAFKFAEEKDKEKGEEEDWQRAARCCALAAG